MFRYRYVTALILNFFAISLNAQIDKKNWLLGGGLGFYHSNTTHNDNTYSKGNNFYISPDAGYFITDKFAAGLNFSTALVHSRSDMINGVDEKHKTLTLAAGPFLRYYFLKKTSDVNLIIQPEFWYKSTFEKGNDNNITTLEYSIAAGPVFFLNKNVALELLGNYVFGKWIDGETQFNRLEVRLGLQVHFFGKQSSNN